VSTGNSTGRSKGNTAGNAARKGTHPLAAVDGLCHLPQLSLALGLFAFAAELARARAVLEVLVLLLARAGLALAVAARLRRGGRIAVIVAWMQQHQHHDSFIRTVASGQVEH
jgi:hypothetical protein